MANSISFPWSEQYKVHAATQGGMGTVFFCQDQVNKRPVVLKTFLRQVSEQHNLQIRFMHEVCNWMYLGAHPNIVQAFGVVSLGNPAQPYLVLEGITAAGEDKVERDVSLQKWISSLKGHAISFARALELVWQVGQAMRHATERIPEFVHRDIKPANILIDRFGKARLSDFGIARSFEGLVTGRELYPVDFSKIEVKNFKPAGTPHYIAPELWEVDGLASCASDVYALGLCFFEMITGRRRAYGNSYAELRECHTKSRLTKIPVQVLGHVREFIDRCCALDPKDRYNNWDDFCAAAAKAYHSLTGQNLVQPDKGSSEHRNEETLKSFFAICDSFTVLNLEDPAQEFASEALKLAGQIEDEALILEAEIKFASLPNALQNTNTIKHLERAITLSKHLSNDESLLECLILKASLYTQLADFEQAKLELSAAEEVAQKNEFVALNEKLIGATANLYALTQEFERAIHQFKQLLAVFVERGDIQNEIRAIGNIAACFADAREYAEGLEWYDKFDHLSEQQGDFNSLELALYGKVRCYENLGDFSRALTALERLAQILRQRGASDELDWCVNKHQDLMALKR